MYRYKEKIEYTITFVHNKGYRVPVGYPKLSLPALQPLLTLSNREYLPYLKARELELKTLQLLEGPTE
jgi:hypothetical protein